MNNALVMDANQRSALAITRSLGKRGICVITADTSVPTLAGSSKYSACSEVLPGHDNEPAFISTLQNIITKHKIDLLIPVTEVSLYTVLKYRTELEKLTKIPLASEKSIQLLSNKAELVKICEALDVPAPKSIQCSPGGKEVLHNKEVEYPVVLKPYKSRIYESGGWVSTSVRYAYSDSELSDLCQNETAFRDHKFLLQEYIEGDGAGVFLLYEKGQCIAQFSHRRLREKPPAGGVSVLSESIPMNEEMLTISRKLLDSANWHGVAMVEFKINRDGKPFIMEINTRFWGSLQLAIDAGVDFPWLLYSMCVENAVIEAQKPYKIGIKLRWLLGDFDRLYLVLRSDSYSIRQKIDQCLKFLAFFTPGLHYEVNRISDMAPFLYELKTYVRALLKSPA